MRMNIKLLSACFFLGLVIALFTVESILPIDPLIQIKPWQPIFREKQFPELVDRRAKLEVVEDLRNQGINAFPNIFPSLYIYNKDLPKQFTVDGRSIYPLSGISNITTVIDKESGEWKIHKTDRYGFNNPEGSFLTEKISVALIGDSYVQGQGVAQDKNLVAVLRKSFSQTVGFGSPDSGPLLQLAQFREYIEPLKPDVVVWVYYEGNDLPNLQKEATEQRLLNYLDPGFQQNLIDYQPEIDKMLTEWIRQKEKQNDSPKKVKLSNEQIKEKWRKTLKLVRLRLLLGLDFSKKKSIPCPPKCHYLPTREPSPMFRDILSMVKNRVEGWDGKLYFVSIPTLVRVREKARNPGYDYNLYRDAQLSLAEELKIPHIDLFPILTSHPDPMSLYPYRRMGHFNEEGYRLIGSAIAQLIKENQSNER